jgi:hypothetical protein
MFISEKVVFKVKVLRRDEDGQHISIQGIIYKEL